MGSAERGEAAPCGGSGRGLVGLTPRWPSGLFVFPLDEHTTVVGFEAAVCRRAITVQIKDKAKIDATYFDGCGLPDGQAHDRSGERVLGGSTEEGKMKKC